MNKKRILNIIFWVYMGVAATWLLFKFTGWDYRSHIGLKPIEKKNQVFEPKDNSKQYTTYDVAVMMHEMANGLIYAEDDKVWGVKEMNKSNIAEVLMMAQSVPKTDETDKFIEIINRWQNGDFTRIVFDHNRVWSLLGGNTGKAKDANVEAVAKAVDRVAEKVQ